MNYTYITRIIGIVALIMLITLFDVVAQDNPVEPEVKDAIELSGKVVDIEGKPIPGFSFSIQSTEQQRDMFPRGVMIPPHLLNQRGGPLPIVAAKTDAEGTFNLKNIRPGYLQVNQIDENKFNALNGKEPMDPQIAQQIRMQMMRFEEKKSEFQILSIRLNNVTFYYSDDGPPHLRGLSFGLKPGTNIKNMKITVKKMLKIRAQIVYADGTPVANVSASLSMRYNGRDFGGRSGSDGASCFTDAQGFFTEYRNEPGYYTLSVNLRGFSGGAGPFLLKKDEHPEKIVIKLNGNPVVPKRPTGENREIDNEKARNIVNVLLNRNNRAEPRLPNVRPLTKPEKLVWIINPANGHAYAKISCQDWHDAQRKAIKEDSHLISINDEDEQFWIDTIFDRSDYWIGLNDIEKEGIWQWDSGEPVTYTNWSTREIFPDNTPDTEKDYVAIVPFFEGGWQSTSPKGHLGRTTHSAIIEKDGLVSKIPKPQDDTEEE
ncbi:MAG: lectin-like protein [Candidatus Poribacteria bacterium]|nr:lectin-like protein [Candidatus Poribacteria bacterium]